MRGRSYRRIMKIRKDRRFRRILHECNCAPSAGYIKYTRIDGVKQPVENRIRYPKNSNMQQYLKKLSSRKIRRSEDVPNGNAYRKYTEYAWQLW